MKTLYSMIVAVLAVSTLAICPSMQAQPNRFGRISSVERADATSAKETKASPAGSLSIAASKPQPAKLPPPVRYPKFKLIDLGALGGDNSFIVGAAKTLNRRGENIAQGSTGLPDPFPEFGFTPDGTIWHGMLTTANGVVRDLGGLNGNHSVPTWISENGLIAGLGENGLLDDLAGFPVFRALLWDYQRNLHDLGTLGGNWSQGQCVNNRGQVVGQAANAVAENPDVASFFTGGLPAAQQSRAYLWEKSIMRDLGTLGGNDAAAVAINDLGGVAGFSATDATLNDTTGLPTIHPFLWTSGHMRDLGSLGGTMATTGSFAFGPWGHILNEGGQVVGTSTLPGDDTFHAFVWDGQRMIDLGANGIRNSEAFFISDKGEVLGRIEVSLMPYVRHAFLWEKGHMTDLGAPAPCNRASPLSINSAGQIVGDTGACTSDPNDSNYFSVFYQEKGKPPVDLHSLITTPTSIHLEDAVYINDRGEISAGGFAPDGTMHAVLLVPVGGL